MEARTARSPSLSSTIASLIFSLLFTLASEAPAALVATFTVNTDDDVDDGVCNANHCSLREAINAANTLAGKDTIAFAIPGAGLHTLTPGPAPLPYITDPVVIDGFTQPGAHANSAPFTDNALRLIDLDGRHAINADGLTLMAGDSQVTGLIIHGFPLNFCPMDICIGGHAILIEGAGSNLIHGCSLGGSHSGDPDTGGTLGGILIQDSSDNRIGASQPVMRNLISGNHGFGIRLEGAGATGNRIEGNLIGTDVSGTEPFTNGHGVEVFEASGTRIGGAEDGVENLISGNTDGVDIYPGSEGTVIQGNLIGTDVSGLSSLANTHSGVTDEGINTRIGGSKTEMRNVIAGSSNQVILDGTGAVVQGNFLCTDRTGTAALASAISGGIFSHFGGGNVIGGPNPGEGNLISGCGELGLQVDSDDNRIQGNLIGVDVTGLTPLGNAHFLGGGVVLFGNHNLLGGAAPGEGNVISDNGGSFGGVRIGGNANMVQGNLIGTDATGSIDFGNHDTGVHVTGNDNLIGGSQEGEGNVISGNDKPGVWIQQGSGNRVQGNFIGTDATGAMALGNNQAGVVITTGAMNTLVGGPEPGAGNLISANGFGIQLSAGRFTRVQGNKIGTDVTGLFALGNAVDGIRIFGNVSDSLIGGTGAGEGNLIAFNQRGGIFAVTASPGFPPKRNAIRGNSIVFNFDLGIDLGEDGVTPDDLRDFDLGPNDRQNFPVITSALVSGGGTTIRGVVLGRPNATYAIDLFSSRLCDPSGFGEGETYLGSLSVVTGPNIFGIMSFMMSVPVPIPVGQVVTATATDAQGNTSEFSACRTVRALPRTLPPPR